MRRVILFFTILTTSLIWFLAVATSAFASVTHQCTGPNCSVGVSTPGSPSGVGTVGSVAPPTSTGGTSGPCPAGETPSYVTETSGGQPIQAQPGDTNPLTGAPVQPGSTLEDKWPRGLAHDRTAMPTHLSDVSSHGVAANPESSPMWK